MNIFELFDQPVQYDWENLDDHGGTATFQIGDNEYQVMVYVYGTLEDEEYYPDEDELPEVDIEFCRMVNNTCVQDITGSGNAGTVFATIVAIMQEYISSHPVGALMFSAKEENRQQLYMRMIKRLLPTWKITRSGGSFYATPPYNRT